jgi:hypothetical protein
MNNTNTQLELFGTNHIDVQDMPGTETVMIPISSKQTNDEKPKDEEGGGIGECVTKTNGKPQPNE